MRWLLLCFVFVPIALGADTGRSYNWKPAPQLIEVAQGKIDIVLSDPIPQHWALTVVVSRDEVPAVAKISAASVDLDGPFIEHVNNLDLRQLDVKPGAVLLPFSCCRILAVRDPLL